MSKTTSSDVQPCVGEPVASWPEEGLEQLVKCPVCGSIDRQLLHEELTDRVFFSAPGTWTLWHCRNCKCAYLDPRPTPETINLAYRGYYTHTTNPSPRPRSLTSRMKDAIKNDYLRARYGVKHKPWLPFGRLLLYIPGPVYLRAADRWTRHLPVSTGESVCLDVGCGDGSFCAAAHACGWEIHGSDPDPLAAEAARQKGMTVFVGRLPNPALRELSYDFVTMSHAIEHTHDPVGTLKEIWKILKPGGEVWIATPNIDSIASRRFGRDWHSLDPPRHLVLFNRASLTTALNLAGFERVTSLPADPRPFWMFAVSHMISEGRNPCVRVNSTMPWSLRLAARFAAARSLVNTELTEELIVISRKPSST